MKKLLFLLLLLPSFAQADRLGSLKASSNVALSTQTVSVATIPAIVPTGVFFGGPSVTMIQDTTHLYFDNAADSFHAIEEGVYNGGALTGAGDFRSTNNTAILAIGGTYGLNVAATRTDGIGIRVESSGGVGSSTFLGITDPLRINILTNGGFNRFTDSTLTGYVDITPSSLGQIDFSATGSSPYFSFNSGIGVSSITASTITASGRIAVGTNTLNGQAYILSNSTTQLTLGYNTTTYMKTQVDINGVTSFDATAGTQAAIQFNDQTQVAMGTSTTYSQVGGRLYTFYASTSMEGSSLDQDLVVTTMTAGAFNRDGDELFVTFNATVTSSANSKTLKVRLDGIEVFNSGALTPSGTSIVTVAAHIIRTSRTTVIYYGSYLATNISATVGSVVATASGLDFDVGKKIAITVKSSGSTANEITLRCGSIDYIPAKR